MENKKALIAYYSRTSNTESAALLIKRMLEEKGWSVDMEKIRPVKEHSFLFWWHIRMVKGECDILPPKIKDASPYDLVCIGTPNWSRLSLPMARYFSELTGLKYKKIALFSTTALLPVVEWYLFSAYFLELSFLSIIHRKRGYFVGSVMFSSLFKKWSIDSYYGKKELQKFIQKIISPLVSFKEYSLVRRKRDNLRLLVVVFPFLFFLFIILRFLLPLIGKNYNAVPFLLLLLSIALFDIFLSTILAKQRWISFGLYLAGFGLVVFTVLSFFAFPFLSRFAFLAIYFSLFSFLSLFRNPELILSSALFSLISYPFFFYSPLKGKIYPISDISLLLFLSLVAFLLSKHSRESCLEALDVQDELIKERQSLSLKVKEKTEALREMVKERERTIRERTLELKKRVEELERFQKITVGRELKMVSLKKDLEESRKKILQLEKNLKKCKEDYGGKN